MSGNVDVSIAVQTKNLAEKLTDLAGKISGSRILITGGTGFIGTWLISTLHTLRLENSIDLEIDVVSRYGKEKSPFSSQVTDSINWINRDFAKESEGFKKPYSHIILGSTPSVSAKGSDDLKLVRMSTVNGTMSVIDSLKSQSNPPRLINLSSGAARQLEKDEPNFFYEGCPPHHFTTATSNYAHSKMQSERLVERANELGLLSGVNLRLFAFAGPLLSLNEHFAVGNFMKDALNRLPISINGNPNTLRSYMYPTDLVRWILTILVSDKTGTFSVGNPSPISIGELARTISRITSQSEVIFPVNDGEFTSYYPDTSITESTFDLTLEVDFETSILNWWTWLNSTNFTQ